MRKKTQVLHELRAASDNLKAVIAKEGATADEIRQAEDTLQKLTDELNQITLTEAAERAALQAVQEGKDVKEVAKRFSFAKFIREAAGENGAALTGVELEVSQMGIEEAQRNNVKLQGVCIPTSILNARAAMVRRTFGGNNAGTEGDGGYLIQSDLQYQEALREQLVLTQCGATYVGGLVGNITLVEGTGVTASWENENDAVGDSKKAFTTRSASPHRLAVNVPISKQLALQSSVDVDALIMADIYAAHAEALEKAALNGTGSKQPTGLLNTSGITTVALDTNGKVPAFADMVSLETALLLNKAAGAAYLTNNKVRGLLKTTLKAAGVPGYIWGENNEVNGYPIYSSNLVPSNLTKGSATTKCSAIIFGEFSNLWIMQWGGLDIIVDPYSLKKQGAYEITMNAYHDVFVRRKEAFAVIKDALTA